MICSPIRAAVLVAAIALANCGGGHSASSPPIPAAQPSSPPRTAMTITIVRSAGTSGTARRPATIPANAASVDARVYVGTSASGAPLSTSCTPFPPGTTSATITVSVPLAVDMLALTSYDGGCTSAGQNGTGTGTALTRFVGSGAVSATSTDIATVFNGGQPVTLSKILPPLPDSVPAISWTSIGPRALGSNGKLQSFVRDPAHPSTMWIAGGFGAGFEVGTQAGVFKTTDNGATWSNVNAGMTDPVVNALWLAPDGSALLAATQFDGLFRSTDGAATWSRTLQTSSTCLISGADGAVYTCGAAGVYRSFDNGFAWTLVYPTAQPVNAMALGGATLYAGTIDNHVASNAGGTWADRGVVGPASTNFGVHALLADTVHGRLFASVNAVVTNSGCPIGCATQALTASADGGASWIGIALPAGARGAQTLAASAVSPGTIYVGDAGPKYRTSDAGATFTQLCCAGDSRGDFVTPSADRRNDIIDSASDQGIFESLNSGGSFTTLARGLSNFVVYDVAVSGGTVVTAIQDFSPFVTNDDGASWQQPNANAYEDGVAWIDPADAAHVYVWDQNGFHRSADGGHTWSSGAGIPATGFGAPDAIATDPTHPGTVYAAASNKVYRSNDYGATFADSGWGFTAPAGLYISRDGKTIVVSDSAANTWTLSWSHDGGASFHRSGYPTWIGSFPFVAISPTDSDVVVAAVYLLGSPAVYRSTDGGQTFGPLASSGLTTQSVPNLRRALGRRARRDIDSESGFPWSNAFTVDAFATTAPQRMRFDVSGSPPLLALSTTTGIFVSSDYGAHWHNETGNAIVHAFYGLGWSGGKLYVSTAGQGVLRSNALR